MKNENLILVINPGSTSTKTALFDRENLIKEENLEHKKDELDRHGSIIDQLEFRTESVKAFLKAAGTDISSLSCIMARGGLLRPLPGGIYRINSSMIDDLRSCRFGRHASNLGALIADSLSRDASESSEVIPAFIADPVVVDELSPLARYSGFPDIKRRSIFHALNHKAVCRKLASDIEKSAEKSVFIIAHMGGGISIALHEYGKVSDVTNALDGEGPFTPERAGALPVLSFMKYAEEKGISSTEAEVLLNRKSGLAAYAGTNNFRELEEEAFTKPETRELIEAMAYQISKNICSFAACTCGKVDAVALTGGLSNSRLLTELIRVRVDFLAPVYLYPESGEMDALASWGTAVTENKAEWKEY